VIKTRKKTIRGTESSATDEKSGRKRRSLLMLYTVKKAGRLRKLGESAGRKKK